MTTKKSLLKKFGSEEAIKEHYRQIGALSKSHPNRAKGNGKTGFATLKRNDPERHAELSKKGGEMSKRGKAVKRANEEI